MIEQGFWDDIISHKLLLNTRIDESTQITFKKVLQPYLRPGHVYLQTSGSTLTGKLDSKFVELPKTALLNSARSVNHWIDSHAKDVWGNSLPVFHVGGLSVYCRAHLSGSSVESFNRSWIPSDFHQFLIEKHVTLTSLVPTQIYDLLALGLRAPESLRLCFVGGGELLPHMRESALKLGWPIVETYGMTEFCSQVATEPMDNLFATQRRLVFLPHIEYRISKGLLELRGSSGFSRQFILKNGKISELSRTLQDWYVTEDMAQWSERSGLNIIGRASRQIKVNGELVNLQKIESTAREMIPSLLDIALLPLPHDRKGNLIVLVGSCSFGQDDIDRINRQLMPFERIGAFIEISDFPKTELNKVKLNLLLDKVKLRLDELSYLDPSDAKSISL